MGDMVKDMQELRDINLERSAAGLEPLRYVEDARAWKQQEADKAVAQTPDEAVKQDEPAKAEAVVEEAAAVIPVAPVAEKAAADERAAADANTVKMSAEEAQALRTERGRASKLAIQLQALEEKLAEAERKLVEAEEKAVEARGQDALLAGLTDDERAGIDPAFLKVVERTIRKHLGQAEATVTGKLTEAERRIAEREAADAQREESARQAAVADMWTNHVSKAIPPAVYGKFATHPQWSAWCQKPFAGSTCGQVYTAASQSADADATVDMLRNFMSFAKIEVPSKGNPPPLKPTEQGSATGAEATPAAEEFYEGEYRQMIDNFAKGEVPSGMTAKDFRSWIERAKQARDNGKMKLGFRPR
jgi:hypothetical protein